MGRNTRSGLGIYGPQPRAGGLPVQDPEFWQPRFDGDDDGGWSGKPGRPRVVTQRRLEDFPPGTPQPTACVLWQGPVDRYGYGVLSSRGKGTSSNHHKRIRAHRWVWEQANRVTIPPGIVIRHKCDNPVCVNVDHLEPGTQGDNVRDAAERQHLGPVRAMSPSQVAEVVRRRRLGETWRSIHADFSQFGMSTVRRSMVLYDGDDAV